MSMQVAVTEKAGWKVLCAQLSVPQCLSSGHGGHQHADGLLSIVTATLRAVSASALVPLAPVTSAQDLLVKSVVRLCQAQPRKPRKTSRH